MRWPFTSTNDSASVHTRGSSRTARSGTPSGLGLSGTSRSGRPPRRRSQSASGRPSNRHATLTSRLTGRERSRTGELYDAGRAVRRSLSRQRKPKSIWDTTVDWLSYAGRMTVTALSYAGWAFSYVPSMVRSTVGWVGSTIGTFWGNIDSSRKSSSRRSTTDDRRTYDDSYVQEDTRGRGRPPRQSFPASSQESGIIGSSGAAPTLSTGSGSRMDPTSVGSTNFQGPTVSWARPPD